MQDNLKTLTKLLLMTKTRNWLIEKIKTNDRSIKEMLKDLAYDLNKLYRI